MKIHEYQGKEVLRKYGVATLRGHLALTPSDAEKAAKDLATPIVVVKAQIHAGGRGKGKFKELGADAKGGVRLSKTLDEVRAYRAHVDAALIAALPDLPEAAHELVALGCHHEEQH